MKTKYSVSTAIAGAALLGTAMFFPASANSEFVIHGNGSRSDNTIDVNFDKNISINQSNDADIDNNFRIFNNTGNNRVSGNTGGDVEINTGDAEANVEISNMAGFNFAQIGTCGCENDYKVSISGNGSRSDNEIDIDFDSDVNVDQDNDTNIDNDVAVVNNTGNNDASGDNDHHWYFDKNDYDHDKDYDHNDYDHGKYLKNDYDKDHHDYDKNHDYSKYHDFDYDHDAKYFDDKHSSDYHKNYLSDNWYDKYQKDYDHDYDWNKKHGYLSYNHDNDWYNKDSKDHDYDRDWDHSDHKYNLSKYHDLYDWLKNHYYGYGGNTGGDVSIETGDANANVTLNNQANANWFVMN